jgi:predicted dehydrogenase
MPTLETEATAFLRAPGKQIFTNPPQVLIIGAGSRGTAYAEAALSSTNAIIAAVCEPNEYKRAEFGRKFIWGEKNVAQRGQSFGDWKEWKEYELERRTMEREGKEVEKGVNAVFVCVLDEMHEEVVCGIADLGVHICCEKPMSTRLESCVRMYKALKSARPDEVNGHADVSAERAANGMAQRKETIFGICHVLRYSPHNMLLRHLVREKEVIGDVLSVEHVEPVGWWHFSHSYVRHVSQVKRCEGLRASVFH